MKNIILIVLLLVFPLVCFAQGDVEELLFECRPGTMWKIKEQNIQKLAEAGEVVIPILIACLKWELPESIANRIARKEKELSHPLPERADMSSMGVQYCAEKALIKIGIPAVPLLLKSIENQPETIATVAKILAEIGDRKAIPALISVLKDEKLGWYNRARAAKALQELDAKEAMLQLIEALKGQSDDPYNNEKFLNYIADALAKLSGQSFGFTFIPEEDTKGKAGIIPAHYIFSGSDEDRTKAITLWKEWIKDQ